MFNKIYKESNALLRRLREYSKETKILSLFYLYIIKI